MSAAVETFPGGRAVPVSMEVGDDGIAVVTLNDTEETHNTITRDFGAALLGALARLSSEGHVRAAVLTSGKRESFVVGANVDMLKAVRFAEDAERLARELAEGLRQIASFRKPVVAAVHGPALGGGFEIALACHAIVATDDPKTVVGFPEVRLGLLPAANGMLRVAERAGLGTALDLALTGKSLRAAQAKKLGLIDDVCAPSVLLMAAKRLALSLEGKTPVLRRAKADAKTLALEANPFGRKVLFTQARERTLRETHGHYPAPARIIDVLERYGQKGFDAAAALEARAFGELVVSETAHRLIEVFFATTALKKDTGVDDPSVKPRSVEQVAILGGGAMGAGIAYVTVDAGLPVRLKEKDDLGAGRALRYVHDALEGRVRRKRMTALERDEAFARFSATTDFSGIRHADLVLEAVFEDLALKQALLREVEGHTGEECIFASNTSSIPIAKIAEASRRPHTVVGMHYFSPVPKMPLLEVIRTDKTAPWVVATAVAVGKRQGKNVIVVRDGVGFYTSRILAPYLNEAAYILAEGVPVDAIDTALVDWGWPVGALRLLDEVGLDVAAHVSAILHTAFGQRLLPPPSMAKLVGDGRHGRKNERGFYRYEARGRSEGSVGARREKREVDPSVYGVLGIAPKAKLPTEEIQMRCALQMVNEAVRCFGEKIVRSPRDGDVGAMFGLGFPPFRGGPFRYVDTIGAAEVLRRIQAYYDRFGARWTPAPLLVEMAKKGDRFYRE
jgi:3-hydroxyacyl-CoA dehydrogenase/enoyl-CoA hydratase/3-hydroxybutyryl-CoA epimerase